MGTQFDGGTIVRPKDDESIDFPIVGKSKWESDSFVRIHKSLPGSGNPAVDIVMQPEEKVTNTSTRYVEVGAIHAMRAHVSGPRFKYTPSRRRPSSCVISPPALRDQDAVMSAHLIPTEAVNSNVTPDGGQGQGLRCSSDRMAKSNAVFSDVVDGNNNVVLDESGNRLAEFAKVDTQMAVATERDLLQSLASPPVCCPEKVVESPSKRCLEQKTRTASNLRFKDGKPLFHGLGDCRVLVAAQESKGTDGMLPEILGASMRCNSLQHEILPSQMESSHNVDAKHLFAGNADRQDDDNTVGSVGRGEKGIGISLSRGLLRNSPVETRVQVQSSAGCAEVDGSKVEGHLRPEVDGSKVDGHRHLMDGSRQEAKSIFAKVGVEADYITPGKCDDCGRVVLHEKADGIEAMGEPCCVCKKLSHSVRLKPLQGCVALGREHSLAVRPNSSLSKEDVKVEDANSSLTKEEGKFQDREAHHAEEEPSKMVTLGLHIAEGLPRIERGETSSCIPLQLLDNRWGGVQSGEQIGGRHHSSSYETSCGQAEVAGVDGGWLSLSGEGNRQVPRKNDARSCASDIVPNNELCQQQDKVGVSRKLLNFNLGLDLGVEFGASAEVKAEEIASHGIQSGWSLERGHIFWRGALVSGGGLAARVVASFLSSDAVNAAVPRTFVPVLEATSTIDLSKVVESLGFGAVGFPFQLLVDSEVEDEDSLENLHEIAVSLLSGVDGERALFIRSPMMTSNDTKSLATLSETSMYILSRGGLESVLGPTGCADLEFGQDWPVLYGVLSSGQLPPTDGHDVATENGVCCDTIGVAMKDSGILAGVGSSLDFKLQGTGKNLKLTDAMELLATVSGSGNGRMSLDGKGDAELCVSDLISLEMSLVSGDVGKATPPPISRILREDSECATKSEMYQGTEGVGKGSLDLFLGLTEGSKNAPCGAICANGIVLAEVERAHQGTIKSEPFTTIVEKLSAKVAVTTEAVKVRAEERSADIKAGSVNKSDIRDPLSTPTKVAPSASQKEQTELQALQGMSDNQDVPQSDGHTTKRHINTDDSKSSELGATGQQLKSPLKSMSNSRSATLHGSRSAGSPKSEERNRQVQQRARAAGDGLRSSGVDEAVPLQKVETVFGQPSKEDEHFEKSCLQKGKDNYGRGGARQDCVGSESREYRRGRSRERKRDDSMDRRHSRSRDKRSGSRPHKRGTSLERGRSLERKRSKSREHRRRDDRLDGSVSKSKESSRKEEMVRDHRSRSKDAVKRVSTKERDSRRNEDRSERGLRKGERRQSAEMRHAERGDLLRREDKVELPGRKHEKSAEHVSLGNETHNTKCKKGADELRDQCVFNSETAGENVGGTEKLKSKMNLGSLGEGTRALKSENKESGRRPCTAEVRKRMGNEGKCDPCGTEAITDRIDWPAGAAGDSVVELQHVRNTLTRPQLVSQVHYVEMKDDGAGWNGRRWCTECGIQVTCLRNLEDHYKGKKHKERLSQLDAQAATLREYRELERGRMEMGGGTSTVTESQHRESELMHKEKSKKHAEDLGLNSKRAWSETHGGRFKLDIDVADARRKTNEDLSVRRKRGRPMSPSSAEVSGSPSKISRRTASHSPRKPGLGTTSWSPKKLPMQPLLGDTGVVVESSPGASPQGGGAVDTGAMAWVMLDGCDPMLKGWLSSDLMRCFLSERYGVQLRVLGEGQMTSAVGPPDDLTMSLEISTSQCGRSSAPRLTRQAAHGIRLLIELHDYCRRGLTPPTARIQILLQEMPFHAKIDLRTHPARVSRSVAAQGSRMPLPIAFTPTIETHVSLLCDTRRGPIDIDTELQELSKFASEQSVPLKSEGFTLGSLKVTVSEQATGPPLPTANGMGVPQWRRSSPGRQAASPKLDWCFSQTSRASCDVLAAISVREGNFVAIPARGSAHADGKWNSANGQALNTVLPTVSVTPEDAHVSTVGATATGGSSPDRSNQAYVPGTKSPHFVGSHGLPPLVPPSPRVGSSPVKDRRGKTNEHSSLKDIAGSQWTHASHRRDIGSEGMALGIAGCLVASPSEAAKSTLLDSVFPSNNGNAAGDLLQCAPGDAIETKDVVSASAIPAQRPSRSGAGGAPEETDYKRQIQRSSGQHEMLSSDPQPNKTPLEMSTISCSDGVQMSPSCQLLTEKVAVSAGEQLTAGSGQLLDAPSLIVDQSEKCTAEAKRPANECAVDKGTSSGTIDHGASEQGISLDVDTGARETEVAGAVAKGQRGQGMASGSPSKKARPSGVRKPDSLCPFPPLLVHNIPESWGMARDVRRHMEATLQKALGPREGPFINRIGFSSKLHNCTAELKSEALINNALAAFAANPDVFEGLQLSRHPEASLNPQAALLHSAKKLTSGGTIQASPASGAGMSTVSELVSKEGARGFPKPHLKNASQEQALEQIRGRPDAEGVKRQLPVEAKSVEPRGRTLPKDLENKDQSNARATGSRKRRLEDLPNGEGAVLNVRGGNNLRQGDGYSEVWEPGEIPPTPHPEVNMDCPKTATVAPASDSKERLRKVGRLRKTAREADEFLQSLQDVVLSPVTSHDTDVPSQRAQPPHPRNVFREPPPVAPERAVVSHSEAGGSPTKKRPHTSLGTSDSEARTGGYRGRSPPGLRSPPGRGPGYNPVGNVRHGNGAGKAGSDTIVLGQLFLKEVPHNEDADSVASMVESVLRELLPAYPKHKPMITTSRVNTGIGTGRAWVCLEGQYMVDCILEAYSKNPNLFGGMIAVQGHDYKNRGFNKHFGEASRAQHPVSPPPMVGGGGSSSRGSVRSRLGGELSKSFTTNWFHVGHIKVQRFRSRDEADLDKSVEIHGLDSNASEEDVVLGLKDVFNQARFNLPEVFVEGVYLYVDNINFHVAVVEFEDGRMMHQTQEPVMTKYFLNRGWHVTPANRKKSFRLKDRIKPAL